MSFVRIDTNDGETRWLNLANISRVTRAADANDETVLIVMFADGKTESTLRIRGDNPVDLAAIDKLIMDLDARCQEQSASAPVLTPARA